jgi:hypothetical protein
MLATDSGVSRCVFTTQQMLNMVQARCLIVRPDATLSIVLLIVMHRSCNSSQLI